MKKELARVLDLHVARYPRLTEQDLVKLVYQSEFGGGHILTDMDRCLAWIEREYAETKQSGTEPLYEDIGFGFFRLQLSALDTAGLTPKQAAERFYASASVSYGSEESYRKKLMCLPSLIDSRFRFTGEELNAWIEGYLSAGGGMQSHTQSYREAYAPAYRVIFLGKDNG